MADEDIRAELQSLQRLEGEFAQHRGQFQRVRDDVLELSSELANFKSTVQGSIADLRTDLKGVSAKLDERSKPPYQALALIPALIAAVWLFVTYYTQSSVSPITAATAANTKAIETLVSSVQTLQQIAAGSTSADVASRTDRSQLNDRVRIVENELAKEVGDRRALASETIAKEIEIETQFCEQGVITNLMHANEMRNMAFLWHKATGDVYPTDNAYYPMVCHQGNQGPLGNHG